MKIAILLSNIRGIIVILQSIIISRIETLNMISQELELNIVMVAWVVALLLGLFLLLIRPPHNKAYTYYKRGKTICAMALLLFGVDILFQWLLRKLAIANPILSVSSYLFTFCAVTLLLATGYCMLLSPSSVNKKQQRIAVTVLIFYATLLVINQFLPSHKLQVWIVLLCCILLFLITCIGIYSCVAVYRRTINKLRTYYSDIVENMLRWMPGVGAGVLVLLLSAPFVCWLPRWVGIYQLVLGTLMFIYSFVCIINFASAYNSLAEVLNPESQENATEETEVPGHSDIVDDNKTGNHLHSSNALSDSLLNILQEKEERWRSHAGYRTRGITIEQAAREMGTNRSYLSRYLNEVKHVTFYEWVAWMRIHEAQSMMLNDRDMPIEQIAGLVGFSSASTFSITFKKLVGISPNQWRNQQ